LLVITFEIQVSAEESFLRGVFGLTPVAQHPVAEVIDGILKSINKVRKGLLVTLERGFDCCSCRWIYHKPAYPNADDRLPENITCAAYYAASGRKLRGAGQAADTCIIQDGILTP